MNTVSRQDMQSMLDTFRTRLQDQLATRQDVQRACDNSRDRVISYMHDYLQQNQQQFIRQVDDRMKVYKDRISSLEYKIQSLEQEVRTVHQLMNEMSQKQRSVVIPNVKEAVSNQHNYRYVQEM